ncbi:hypothetical protein [Xanthomonas sp. GW]|nr:hypothetical protein [Xanthomonas sp. GW]
MRNVEAQDNAYREHPCDTAMLSLFEQRDPREAMHQGKGAIG